MGNPKQKWTSEEEEALRAGVAKHGTGKWKDIQRDPEFNPFLSTRSNIDLKVPPFMPLNQSHRKHGKQEFNLFPFLGFSIEELPFFRGQ